MLSRILPYANCISSQRENQENIVVKCISQRFSLCMYCSNAFQLLVLRNSVFKHQNTRYVLYFGIFACFSYNITLIVYLCADINTLIVYYLELKQKKNADTFADVIEIFSKIIVDCGV